MKQRELYMVVLILFNMIVQASANLQYQDDDKYRLLKRSFFNQNPTSRSSSVIDNLVRPSSIRAPTIWNQKTTDSPSYSSSGSCMSNSCEHGGICTRKGQMTYECKCIGPWRGHYCGVANACYNSPCQNGGSCLNVYDDYWCKCTNDYYGKNCQTKYYNPSSLDNNCRVNICNTGRCVSLKTTYYCQCPDDRYGEHCEKRMSFSKRNVSNRLSYYQLLNQIQRSMGRKHNAIYDGNNGERAYYDFKNGIYF